MEHEFRIHGERALRATMMELERKVDKGMQKGFVKFSKEVFKESQRLVPVRSGTLKKSGKVIVKRVGRVDIVYKAPYAAAVEYGHPAFKIPANDIGESRPGKKKGIYRKRHKGVPIQIRPGVWRFIVTVPAMRPRAYLRGAIETVKLRAQGIYRDHFKQFLQTLRGP